MRPRLLQLENDLGIFGSWTSTLTVQPSTRSGVTEDHRRTSWSVHEVNGTICSRIAVKIFFIPFSAYLPLTVRPTQVTGRANNFGVFAIFSPLTCQGQNVVGRQRDCQGTCWCLNEGLSRNVLVFELNGPFARWTEPQYASTNHGWLMITVKLRL